MIELHYKSAGISIVDGGIAVFATIENINDTVLRPYDRFIERTSLGDRRKWAEALLSGLYEQGLGFLAEYKDAKISGAMETLHVQDCKFCCLGVGALVLRGKELEEIMDLPLPRTPLFPLYPKVTMETGDIFLAVESAGDQPELASDLNDGYMLNFEQIAALVCPEIFLDGTVVDIS